MNQESNQIKSKVCRLIEGLIKQIKNQEPNCKRRSNLRLTIEFEKRKIA
jgi:hypothetical protein